MKEIFEVDLKGNAGNTIKNIVSISKNTEVFKEFDPTIVVDKYLINLEYHNGKKETLKFSCNEYQSSSLAEKVT